LIWHSALLQIKEEFAHVFPLCDRRLCNEWPRCKEAVLRLAQQLPHNTDLQAISFGLQDNEDEGLLDIICIKG
jgi:hypothetical protein